MKTGWKILLFLPLLLSIPTTTLAEKLSSQLTPSSIDRVIIVSGEKNSIPDSSNKIVDYNREILLYAIIKFKGNYYLGYENSSLPDSAKIRGKIYSLKRWKSKSWGKLIIKWYKVMPREAPSKPKGTYKWYSNVFSEEEGEAEKWRGWQIIEYKQYPLKERGWSLKPERKAGTVRYRVEVVFNGKVFSSPGKPDPTNPSGISAADYDKGIKETVHRITRLSNHSNKLIRYVEALRGVPWLWGADYRDPPKNTPSKHQSDFANPVGIECSSLLISALRAMGNKELKYTTTESLAKGQYTKPITNATLTLVKRTFFKNWVPRGICWSKDGRFYVYGSKKIQIRDEQFNLIKEVNKFPFEFIDIALQEEGRKIYCIGEKDFVLKIFLIEKEGKSQKELFTPKVKKTIAMGNKEYICKVKINPTGIEIGNSSQSPDNRKEQIYLLDSGTIYVFDLKGNELSAIHLEGIGSKWIPTGSLSLKEGLFYIPVQEKKILVYNHKGKIIKTIDLKEKILDIDVNKEKIVALHPFPLRVEIYNINGIFLHDFSDKFLNEREKRVTIKIGSSPSDLHIGDLLITISPTYHLLILYQDNGNGVLDSKDEVICAGHHGVEIRKVSYFQGRKFILKRLNPHIKI